MRNVIIVIVAIGFGLAIWVAAASWRWDHLDMAQLFSDRVASETPAGTTLRVTPGTILVGDLSDTSRLVCGTASVKDASGASGTHEYSIVVIKTLFGHAINDGYTPAASAQNEALSGRNCAQLQAHAVAHAGTSSR